MFADWGFFFLREWQLQMGQLFYRNVDSSWEVAARVFTLPAPFICKCGHVNES